MKKIMMVVVVLMGCNGATVASMPTVPDKGCCYKKRECSANIYIVNTDCNFIDNEFLNSYLRYIAEESCNKNTGKLLVSVKDRHSKNPNWCVFDWAKVNRQVGVKIKCVDKSKNYFCSVLFLS